MFTARYLATCVDYSLIKKPEDKPEWYWEKFDRIKGTDAGIEAARECLMSMSLRKQFGESLESYLNRYPSEREKYDAAMQYIAKNSLSHTYTDQELVQSVIDYALKHWSEEDTGWDRVYSDWEPSDILREIKGARTPEEAILAVVSQIYKPASSDKPDYSTHESFTKAAELLEKKAQQDGFQANLSKLTVQSYRLVDGQESAEREVFAVNLILSLYIPCFGILTVGKIDWHRRRNIDSTYSGVVHAEALQDQERPIRPGETNFVTSDVDSNGTLDEIYDRIKSKVKENVEKLKYKLKNDPKWSHWAFGQRLKDNTVKWINWIDPNRAGDPKYLKKMLTAKQIGDLESGVGFIVQCVGAGRQWRKDDTKLWRLSGNEV